MDVDEEVSNVSAHTGDLDCLSYSRLQAVLHRGELWDVSDMHHRQDAADASG